MINSSCIVLLNSTILTPFVKIILAKTNIHDYRTVNETFDIISRWFTFVYNTYNILPSTFDYNFFVNALVITIKSEISFNVSKALWFLYKHYHLIVGTCRMKLIYECLLIENFGRLFFNWSFDVRSMFMCFVLYRIMSRDILTIENEPSDPQTDAMIYYKVLELVENLQ